MSSIRYENNLLINVINVRCTTRYSAISSNVEIDHKSGNRQHWNLLSFSGQSQHKYQAKGSYVRNAHCGLLRDDVMSCGYWVTQYFSEHDPSRNSHYVTSLHSCRQIDTNCTKQWNGDFLWQTTSVPWKCHRKMNEQFPSSHNFQECN